MKVSFATNKLAKVLNDYAALVRVYGKLAKPIKSRLSTLQAAPTLDDVPKGPPDRCHQLTQNRDESFAVDVSRKDRLIFNVDHDPVPRKADGSSIDLKSVTAIVVTEISDHYS